jgi:hypothetical protein
MGLAGEPITLDDRALLHAWEQGASVSAAWRPAALVAAAVPSLGVPAERLSVGARDTLLLAVRVGTVGTQVSGVVTCPECGAESDLAVDAAALLAGLPAVEDDVATPQRVERDGVFVSFRLADTTDLVAIAHLDEASAPATMLRRCIVAVGPSDAPLTADLAEAVAFSMAQADPASDIRLRVECSACGHSWSAPWDVASFLWQELEVAARALVIEVDALARRYGWSEAEVLAMTRARRRTYLELA